MSGVSHSPVAGRQTTELPWKRSAGQLALLPVQVSATSHGPASGRQTVVLDTKASAGHAALLPVQVSATSHTPADARHTVVAGLKSSRGQAALVPVHVSGSSHTPAAGRHTVVAGRNPSAGHAALLPVQVSATSHVPADARQTVVFGANALAGQSALLPVQVSATSHTPADARQTAVFGANALGGQSALLPVQVSATSQTPVDGRQTVVLGANVSAGQSALLPVQVSATSQTPVDSRQTVELGRNVSGGHCVLAAVQVSATSHTPAAARQTTPTAGPCWQVPAGQVSVVHALPSSHCPGEEHGWQPSMGVPGVQVPFAEQTSFAVHWLPSNHATPGVGVNTHVPCLMQLPGRSHPAGSGHDEAWHCTSAQLLAPGWRMHCLTALPITKPQTPLPPAPQASTVQVVPSPMYVQLGPRKQSLAGGHAPRAGIGTMRTHASRIPAARRELASRICDSFSVRSRSARALPKFSAGHPEAARCKARSSLMKVPRRGHPVASALSCYLSGSGRLPWAGHRGTVPHVGAGARQLRGGVLRLFPGARDGCRTGRRRTRARSLGAALPRRSRIRRCGAWPRPVSGSRPASPHVPSRSGRLPWAGHRGTVPHVGAGARQLRGGVLRLFPGARDGCRTGRRRTRARSLGAALPRRSRIRRCGAWPRPVSGSRPASPHVPS